MITDLSNLNGDRAEDRARFTNGVWAFFDEFGRAMAWRDDSSPYNVFVSEIMLQQTQVSRVAEKFPLFLTRFPGFRALAEAPFADVLPVWSGLGYNRRARYLHESARRIVREHGGVLPEDPAVLATLPGIGPNTAGSIAAFAYNHPSVFIETNIRRLFIHAFFTEQTSVHDREILPLVEATLDRERPREWYWAMMDAGVEVARHVSNPNRRSSHYAKQAPFANSNRQLRGRVLAVLAREGLVAHEDFPAYTGFPAERVESVLADLAREGLITRNNATFWRLPE